jgi:aerobic-type carbon monoxide dehydrogenase small subunit (CoxS/CutS family)
MPRAVSFTLNGKAVRLDTDDGRTLLWVLRGDLGLTGTKYGCGVGLCGSCTVVLDGKAVRSCRMPLSLVEGKQVTTIEGLARDGKLNPLQQAFIDKGGYCTPGMIMSAYGLLQRETRPSRTSVAEALEGNLCRCGAYKRILEAVEAVAQKGGRS